MSKALEEDKRSEAKHPLSETKPPNSGSAWAPLTIPLYRSFWIAGLFSNMGTWMHETGSQWLMTSLDPSPHMVAAVRVAMTIPVFCLALPAGVWADRFDRRMWLISTQLLLLSIAGLMTILAFCDLLTPTWLLVLTATMGVAVILNQPAWQALTPELVPAALVPSAVQAGSVSFNLARSLGPALAGLIIASGGVGGTYLFNALSFLGVIAVLLVWRPEPEKRNKKPEFMNELRKGLFVVSNSPNLRHVLLRVFVFSASASILWSLLSLVATEKLGFREKGFGSCLGLIGTGAVAGVWWLPEIRRRFSSESIMLVAQFCFALVCLLIGFSSSKWLIIPALLVVGACWMTTMTTLNATAQVYLPRKFRARGMAAYMMCFAMGMALGSAVWGGIGYGFGISFAFVAAAIVLAAGAVIIHPLKVGSMHVGDN